MNETWTKRMLIASAVWNLSGGITSLADPANHFAQMYTVPVQPDALLMYFYQCTWINVIAWGVAYLLAAIWPQHRKAVLVAGGAGKAVYFLACAALVASGLAMAGLFAWALLSQSRSERRERAWAAA
jgi:hypothetical protein